MRRSPETDNLAFGRSLGLDRPRGAGLSLRSLRHLAARPKACLAIDLFEI